MLFYINRWNSTYDSVSQLVLILKDNSDKINKCMDYCSLQRLTNNEIKFLDEYCQVNWIIHQNIVHNLIVYYFLYYLY